MFKLFAVATYALATLSAVSGVAIVRDSKPATYNEGILEKYADYHGRYMALSCNAKHNTQFFDDCCHPMLKGETLANNRKAYCNPSASASVVSSAAQATPTADDDDDDCDDEDDETTVTPTPTPTPSPVNPSPSPVKTTAAAQSSAPVNAAPEPPKPSSSEAPEPQPTPAPSGNYGQEHEGHATYFYQNNTPGACGILHSDSDYIVALDYRTYGDTSQRSQYCGKQVVITDEKTGKTLTATVADACPTCDSAGSLDLSEGLFAAFRELSVGQFNIKWHFA